MLQYLQGNTRPDISFEVCQYIRYIHSHTNMHIMALKRIGRYLLKTSERALFWNLHLTLKLAVTWICTLLDYLIGKRTVAIKVELVRSYASAVVLFFGLHAFKMK